jgi:Domain of unknown function (DUF2017)
MTATFTNGEVELLSTLAGQLIDMLVPVTADAEDAPLPGLTIGGAESISDDPAIARLLPNAYADDEDAAEFRHFTEFSLAERKIANAQSIANATLATDGVVTLDSAEAGAWMRSLTDIRLTIATRLGIETDDSVIPDDPESEALADVYDWLAGVQDSLVRAVDA